MNAIDLMYIPAALLTAPLWAGKKRAGWGERFGRVHVPEKAGRPRVLLHAVSVGEVGAIRELVPLLTPHVDVVVSATTDTGVRRATDVFRGVAQVTRYPLDFSWSVRRFLDAVRPDAVALVELEVWPNFVDACVARRIPVGIVNGRLSARSFRGYRRISSFMRRRLREMAFVAAQDVDYAGRFQALGVAPANCRVTGSMKWDAARIEDGPVAGAEELARALGIDRSRPLIVAGSTGPGEEAVLHAACPPGVQLLCAPRKPERFDRAATELPGCVRRTHRREGAGEPGASRFLLDTIGELRKAYSLADVAVVGRSFMGDLYGSDPIEPIALGKATVIGPHVGDFENIVEAFVSAEGIRKVDRAALAETLEVLTRDAAARTQLMERGRGVIRRHQGASARHAELVLGMLPSPRSGATMTG